jgi:hypothetical protein
VCDTFSHGHSLDPGAPGSMPELCNAAPALRELLLWAPGRSAARCRFLSSGAFFWRGLIAAGHTMGGRLSQGRADARPSCTPTSVLTFAEHAFVAGAPSWPCQLPPGGRPSVRARGGAAAAAHRAGRSSKAHIKDSAILSTRGICCVGGPCWGSWGARSGRATVSLPGGEWVPKWQVKKAVILCTGNGATDHWAWAEL